jgi:hypothetical protein
VQEKTQKLLHFWTKKKLAKAKLKNKSPKEGRERERERRKEYLIRAEEAEDFAPSILAQTIPTTKLGKRGREGERQIGMRTSVLLCIPPRNL